MDASVRGLFQEAVASEILNFFSPRDAGDAHRIRECSARIAAAAEVHFGEPAELIAFRGEIKEIRWKMDSSALEISLPITIPKTEENCAALSRIHKTVTVRGMFAAAKQDAQMELPVDEATNVEDVTPKVGATDVDPFASDDGSFCMSEARAFRRVPDGLIHFVAQSPFDDDPIDVWYQTVALSEGRQCMPGAVSTEDVDNAFSFSVASRAEAEWLFVRDAERLGMKRCCRVCGTVTDSKRLYSKADGAVCRACWDKGCA